MGQIRYLLLGMALVFVLGFSDSQSNSWSNGDDLLASDLNSISGFLDDIDDCSAGEAVSGAGSDTTPTNCLDVLTEAELDSLSELQAQISDATLAALGATSDGLLCTWDNGNSRVVCNSNDDDTPESGDFGAAGDLEADGTLSAGVVDQSAMADDAIGADEMADDDFGDFSCSSGSCTFDAGVLPWDEAWYTGDASTYTDGTQCRRNSSGATITITSLHCFTNTGSENVNLLIKTDPSQSGSDVCNSDIAADTNAESCGTFGDDSLADGEWMCLHIPSGSAVVVGCTATGTRG